MSFKPLARRTKVVAAVLTAGLIAGVGVTGVRASRKKNAGSGHRRISLVTNAASGAASATPAPRARGCGASRPAPGDGTTMTTPNLRTFHVWGPASYDDTRPYPVVLAFHGWYSKGRELAKWFKMQDHVDGAAFTVYPDSDGPKWDFAGAQDLDFTAEVLEMLANSWCIDRSRVLAFGFSYGGRFVNHLGCKRPDLVTAISSGGGAWDAEAGCVGPLPVLVTHRTRDQTMVIAGGKAAGARWATIDGCSTETEETDAAHGCVGYRGCTSGSVTFCEDTHHDPSWSRAWNHTVREEYRDLTWRWFEELR